MTSSLIRVWTESIRSCGPDISSVGSPEMSCLISIGLFRPKGCLGIHASQLSELAKEPFKGEGVP